MRWLKPVASLLAGLLLFDLLLNLPALSAASPAASLLAPSIDLLVMAAACLGIRQAAERSRRGLRIAVSLLAGLLLAYGIGARFGFDVVAHLFGDGNGIRIAASCVASAIIAAAALLAAYLFSGLLMRGFAPPLIPNVFLLVIALCVILQVVSGLRVFAPSVVPRIIKAIASAIK